MALVRDVLDTNPKVEPENQVALNRPTEHNSIDKSTAAAYVGKKPSSSAHSVVEHPAQSPQPPISTCLEALTVQINPKGLCQRCSSPNLAQQLSHKLSQTFGNPTIVHRPNMRTRPSLMSICEAKQANPCQEEVISNGKASTSPSSYTYSGSTSIGDPSTTKTSLESSPTSQRSIKAQEGRDGLADSTRNGAVARDKALTPIQEAPPVVSPTIATVETAANAKIYFETHFNSLLAGHTTPRSLRRRQFELKLQAQSLSEEQKHLERAIWANLESDHLRSTRAIKSRLKPYKCPSKVAVAGYQVVRVLGKGSFGVVRLVRECEQQTSDPANRSQAITCTNSHPKSESNGLRTTAFGALKSTFDLPRLRHRYSSNKNQKEVYAMKVIRKSDMLRNCQEGHLRAERDFLVSSEHSNWVIPLIASFQDHKHLYLVMEYMVGGDFLGLLFRKNILKEKHAKWYIAEMILCVEETHRAGWIHRDIKPDNFLISSSGHLKISDFGLAFDGHWMHDQGFFRSQRTSLMENLGIKVKGDKEDQEEDRKEKSRSMLANILTDRKKDKPKLKQFDGPTDNEKVLQWRNRIGQRHMAASIVGTSQYMAPEVIRGDAYDGRCDWWSIGIILYEVMV